MTSPFSPERQALLDHLLKVRRAESGRILRSYKGGYAPLSYVQEGLWLLGQLEPENPFYNVGTAFISRGPLDVAALEYGLNYVVKRHGVLRTAFIETESAPVQKVLEYSRTSLPVERLPLTGSQTEIQEAAAVVAQNEINRLLDFKRGEVLRARLFIMNTDTSMLVVTAHHLVCDAWSTGILMEEIAECYSAFRKARQPLLPSLPIEYVDFAIWQRETLTSEALGDQLQERVQALSGCPPLRLPGDYEDSTAFSYRGGISAFRIEETLLRRLRELARKANATLFMVLLTGFITLLHRYTGEYDIAVGSPISGRHREELEKMIGFFANTLVLRNDMSGDPTYGELLQRVRQSTMKAFARQAVPFKSLVEALSPERKDRRTPLFQVLFSMFTVRPATVVLPCLEVKPLTIDPGTAKFDLSLDILETPTSLEGTIEYSTDVFSGTSIAQIVEHYQSILNQSLDRHNDPISTFDLSDEFTRNLIHTLEAQADFDFQANPLASAM